MALWSQRWMYYALPFAVICINAWLWISQYSILAKNCPASPTFILPPPREPTHTRTSNSSGFSVAPIPFTLGRIPKFAPISTGHACTAFTTIETCLWDSRMIGCIWCAPTQSCLAPEHSHTCPNGAWCDGQIGRDPDYEFYYGGTFNQIMRILKSLLETRALNLVYVPYTNFTTRRPSGDDRLFVNTVLNMNYIIEKMKYEVCIIPSLPDTSILPNKGTSKTVNYALHSDGPEIAAYQREDPNIDIFNYWWSIELFRITSVRDNDFVQFFWHTLRISDPLLLISHDIMKELNLVTGKYIAIHLRVEADWLNSARAFPSPEDLLKKIYGYQNSTEPSIVYIACGEPFTSPNVAPYISTLQGAGFTVLTKPEMTKYLPDCGDCFDVTALVDYEIMVGAKMSLGVQQSTFYMGVYLKRVSYNKVNTHFLLLNDCEEIWWGWDPLKYNQAEVDRCYAGRRV
eukprot:Phypoly_transcript_06549.p1 GENE.Phypoly_transcript_06549~~Phypoly_transcript_06549.p1  ORF type:complete len:457 (+),score=23.55 Phypoly_transcript_06549:64-1434(+)